MPRPRRLAPIVPLLTALAAGACGSPRDPAPDAALDASPDASSADTALDAPTDTPSTDAPPDGPPVFDWDAGACNPTTVPADPLAEMRAACTFAAGARVADTIGLDAAARARIPITHVIIVTQENRSFDHYFGRLAANGQPDAEGFPATYTNPDTSGAAVSPAHLTTTCVHHDPPHGWDPMHASWDNGAMDGFLRAAQASVPGNLDVLGYYDATDLPFYYWLASTYAISDRHFASVLGPTWPNRDYLYAGTSNSVRETGGATLTGVRTIFDQLTDAGVAWGVYTDGTPRQDTLGWTSRHDGVHVFNTLLAQLADGSLPPVAFVDPTGLTDEHPTGDVQRGEAWSRRIYLAAIASPLWPSLAVIYTYDESGGFFDHVAPPAACPPAADQAAFDHFGVRVPFTVVSPWARPHAVSHRPQDHTSVLRFVQALHDLPALTARDANADALLDFFDFGCAALAHPPAPPLAGSGGCN